MGGAGTPDVGQAHSSVWAPTVCPAWEAAQMSPHCTGEETEAQKSEMVYPRSHNQRPMGFLSELKGFKLWEVGWGQPKG